MIIALDMDEVLVKFVERFIEFHDDIYKINSSVEQFTSYNFEVVYGGTREEITEKVRQFFYSGYCIDIKPVDGAKQGVEILYEKHHELCVVTARPHFSKEQTLKSLDILYPDRFSSINLTNQWHSEGERKMKSEVCKELGAKLIVDDSLAHAYDCAENGIDVLLFDDDYPWNQKDDLHERIKRVHSWEEALKEIDNYEKRR